MSASVLIETVKTEGFGAGGVVGRGAFINLQVAGVLKAAVMATPMVARLTGPTLRRKTSSAAERQRRPSP